jgi:hypothetical protein
MRSGAGCGCLGNGTVAVHSVGLVDNLYNGWIRNPMQVKAG